MDCLKRLVPFFALLLIPSLGWAPISTRLNITEQDGSPSTWPYQAKFSNGTVTDNGDGTVSISNSGGGGVSTIGISSGSATTSVIVSSPTSNVIFDSSTINVALQGTTSSYVSLTSSVTKQGVISAASLGALTANQTITLSGEESGSGSTAISVTHSANQPNIVTLSASSTTISGASGARIVYGLVGSTVNFTAFDVSTTSMTVSGAGGILATYGITAPTETLNSFNSTASSVTVTGASGLKVSNYTTIGGSLTVTGGIVGSTGTLSAATGNWGEYLTAFVTATNFPASGNWGDDTSIALTAGDWDVYVFAELGTATTEVELDIGISTTTGNSVTLLTSGDTFMPCPLPTASTDSSCAVRARLLLPKSETAYFKYKGNYSVGTPQARGRIYARRMQ